MRMFSSKMATVLEECNIEEQRFVPRFFLYAKAT
jgi:hypothetical protein